MARGWMPPRSASSRVGQQRQVLQRAEACCDLEARRFPRIRPSVPLDGGKRSSRPDVAHRRVRWAGQVHRRRHGRADQRFADCGTRARPKAPPFHPAPGRAVRVHRGNEGTSSRADAERAAVKDDGLHVAVSGQRRRKIGGGLGTCWRQTRADVHRPVRRFRCIQGADDRHPTRAQPRGTMRATHLEPPPSRRHNSEEGSHRPNTDQAGADVHSRGAWGQVSLKRIPFGARHRRQPLKDQPRSRWDFRAINSATSILSLCQACNCMIGPSMSSRSSSALRR